MTVIFDLALPASSKQKLQALAKDELLASLNVPLPRQDDSINTTVVIDEPAIEDNVENKKKLEKERKENKRMLIIEEILETEKNYICCLDTLNTVRNFYELYFILHLLILHLLLFKANDENFRTMYLICLKLTARTAKRLH